MASEFNSDYKYKYDVIRNQIFELLHYAFKMQPSNHTEEHPVNAFQRIAGLFLELLERQFPIDDSHPSVQVSLCFCQSIECAHQSLEPRSEGNHTENNYANYF